MTSFPLPIELTALLQCSLPHQLTPTSLSLILSSLSSPSLPTRTLALASLSRILSPVPSPHNLNLLKSTVQDLLSGTSTKDYIQAFQALSALLKVVPRTGQDLLLDEGLRESLQDAVELVAGAPHNSSKSGDREEEQLALVELISLAAGQSGVRATIRISAGRWIESLVQGQGNDKIRALAGVGLAKLMLGKEKPEEGTTGEEEFKWVLGKEKLLEVLIGILVTEEKRRKVLAGSKKGAKVEEEEEEMDDDTAMLSSLEGIAYLTLESSPNLKNQIVKDRAFLLSLYSLVTPPTIGNPPHYAVATVLRNLTTYPPSSSTTSEIARLKAYANANPHSKPPSIESKSSVNSRINLLLASSTKPDLLGTISSLAKSTSLPTRRLISKIVLSLSEEQLNRPKLLQNGLAKSLLLIIEHVPTSSPSPPPPNATVPDSTIITYDDIVIPSQALAKLLITTNPSLVFDPTRLGEAARVLCAVLGSEWEATEANGGGEVDLIKFECLMALTNIASLNEEMSELIASLRVPQLASSSSSSSSFLTSTSTSTSSTPPTEFLPLLSSFLLSPVPLLTRATTELLCNLSPTPSSLSYFALSPSPTSTLHILLALFNGSEDEKTRLAAGGALASLVGVEEIARRCVEVGEGKGFEGLVRLLVIGEGEDEEEEDEGIRVRAYAIFETMAEVGAGDEVVRTRLRECRVVEVLEKAVERENGTNLKGAAKGALMAARKAIA